LQDLCYTGEEFRQNTNAYVLGEGVADVEGGDLTVTSTATNNNSINIAGGKGFVKGDDAAPDQGMYRVRNDGTETVQLSANGSANPQIDTVVFRVFDNEYGGGLNEARLQVIQGSPSPGAQVTNPAGANYHDGVAAVPDNAIVLAYIRNIAGSTLTTTIAAIDIEDARESYRRSGRAYQLRVFNTSGTFEKADHPWAKQLRVTCVGGGGAGGGAATTAAGEGAGGSGGGAGGMSSSGMTIENVAASEIITVGAGGTGASGADGGNGFDSSFGTTVIGKGGTGGKAMGAGATIAWITGGLGGVAGTGTLSAPGAPGQQGARSTTNAMGGSGGSSPVGGGGPGRTSASDGSGAGFAASANSGGGGGGACNDASEGSARTGGAGGSGVVIVEIFG
jgi:hypothetical protein